MSVSRRNAQLSRPTPLSVPTCGFCKMLADRTVPREQASLDYLSPPFQLSNWKWRHAGRPPPVVLRTFSLARFPLSVQHFTLQMHVTSDKSFYTSGEVSRLVSLSHSVSMRRPITVKDPHLLCSRARASGLTRADQRRQSSPSGFADAGVHGSAITTRASLHACVATGAIHLSAESIVLMPVSW